MSDRGRAGWRKREPVTLADQLVAWRMWRRGKGVAEIAQRVGRYPSQMRVVLFGAEVGR